MTSFPGDGSTETMESAEETAERVDRFGALARANGWYGHVIATDRMALDHCRWPNQRRRHHQNHLAPVSDVWCVRETRAARQQDGLAG